MADIYDRGYRQPLHPLHAILLAFPLPLFVGAMVSDVAYWNTYHVQWHNFAAWLNAGALLFGGFVLLWSLVELIRSGEARTGRHVVYFLALLIMFALGFINALMHGKDAWATMPEGLWLSIIVALLALIAAWVGYAGLRGREVR